MNDRTAPEWPGDDEYRERIRVAVTAWQTGVSRCSVVRGPRQRHDDPERVTH